MKRCLTVLLVLLVLASLPAACAPSPASEGTAAPPSSPNIPDSDDEPDENGGIVAIDIVIEALQDPESWVVIDVRTAEEFSGESRLPNAYGSGRLKGAVNVSRELAFDSDGERLPLDELAGLYEFIGGRKAIVYCHGGARSAIIFDILIELGYDAFNYSGSWIDWSRAASVASGDPSDVVLSLTEEWTDNEG